MLVVGSVWVHDTSHPKFSFQQGINEPRNSWLWFGLWLNLHQEETSSSQLVVRKWRRKCGDIRRRAVVSA